MSSYGWGEFGRSVIAGAIYLFVFPLVLTLIITSLISGGFALWYHSWYPFLWGLIALIPTYIFCFFAHYFYMKSRH